MQLVRHLLEDLARFNPEAEVSPAVVVDSISPQTKCEITLATESALEERIKELEDELATATDDLKSHDAAFEEMEEILMRGDGTDEEIQKEILTIVQKHT